MNGGERRSSNDLYGILGLSKECTPSELRNAYKRLAMRWHPDRCSASGNSKFVDEAKKKFQAIQEAYSVLSDDHKRFLYDVGAYDSDDDESNNGMGAFLNEMAGMMSHENGEESFEELQELFDELFQEDMMSSAGSNKRNAADMSSGASSEDSYGFDPHYQSFCFGTGGGRGSGSENRKGDRKRNPWRSKQ